MSTIAKLSLPEYDLIATAGVFDGMNKRRIELIRGELREMGSIAKLSVDEYNQIIAAGVFDGKHQRRIELIQGEMREMNPIGPEHEETVDRLTEWSLVKVPLDLIRVRVQNSIGLPKSDSAPQPDIVWVKRKNYSGGRPIADDLLLVIEVAESSLAGDRREKADLYAKAGIQDYWIVNLLDHTIEVRRDPQDGKYRDARTFASGEELSPLAAPEARLQVSALFAAGG